MATPVESRTDLIQRAFDSHAENLGTVERNTEIKVVFLMLWELDWDPVRDIASCFQIERWRFKKKAKAALAADFALRDDTGICAVGEVKHWNVRDKDWPKAVAQAKKYQDALKVPRAFISCGHRWTILDGDREHNFDDRNAESLLKKLGDFLRKGKITNQVQDDGIWRYGVCPTDPSLRVKRAVKIA